MRFLARLGLATASLLLASTGVAAGAPPPSNGPTAADSPGGADYTRQELLRYGLPDGGHWQPYTPQPTGAAVAPQQLVPANPLPCPAGTTNYPRPNEEYSCMSVYADNANTGHLVGLRRGKASAGDLPGFGYLHALIDHDVDEETIGTVIVNNAYGLRQPNGRYLYGLRYMINGDQLISVEVYEQREPAPNFNDGYAFGVVTAFCPGYDVCPPGVNESIP